MTTDANPFEEFTLQYMDDPVLFVKEVLGLSLCRIRLSFWRLLRQESVGLAYEAVTALESQRLPRGRCCGIC